MKFNLLELPKSPDALRDAPQDVKDRISRPYGDQKKRTFSRVLHVTVGQAHNNYDRFVLAVMSRIHGKQNRDSWAGTGCDVLKTNLELIYTRLRWLLLNVGTVIPRNAPRENLEDLEWMLTGDPMAGNKIAIIEDQGNYYLADRITR